MQDWPYTHQANESSQDVRQDSVILDAEMMRYVLLNEIVNNQSNENESNETLKNLESTSNELSNSIIDPKYATQEMAKEDGWEDIQLTDREEPPQESGAGIAAPPQDPGKAGERLRVSRFKEEFGDEDGVLDTQPHLIAEQMTVERQKTQDDAEKPGFWARIIYGIYSQCLGRR
jgi:hypothetical protein